MNANYYFNRFIHFVSKPIGILLVYTSRNIYQASPTMGEFVRQQPEISSAIAGIVTYKYSDKLSDVVAENVTGMVAEGINNSKIPFRQYVAPLVSPMISTGTKYLTKLSAVSVGSGITYFSGKYLPPWIIDKFTPTSMIPYGKEGFQILVIGIAALGIFFGIIGAILFIILSVGFCTIIGRIIRKYSKFNVIGLGMESYGYYMGQIFKPSLLALYMIIIIGLLLFAIKDNYLLMMDTMDHTPFKLTYDLQVAKVRRIQSDVINRYKSEMKIKFGDVYHIRNLSSAGQTIMNNMKVNFDKTFVGISNINQLAIEFNTDHLNNQLLSTEGFNQLSESERILIKAKLMEYLKVQISENIDHISKVDIEQMIEKDKNDQLDEIHRLENERLEKLRGLNNTAIEHKFQIHREYDKKIDEVRKIYNEKLQSQIDRQIDQIKTAENLLNKIQIEQERDEIRFLNLEIEDKMRIYEQIKEDLINKKLSWILRYFSKKVIKRQNTLRQERLKIRTWFDRYLLRIKQRQETQLAMPTFLREKADKTVFEDPMLTSLAFEVLPEYQKKIGKKYIDPRWKLADPKQGTSDSEAVEYYRYLSSKLNPKLDRLFSNYQANEEDRKKMMSISGLDLSLVVDKEKLNQNSKQIQKIIDIIRDGTEEFTLAELDVKKSSVDKYLYTILSEVEKKRLRDVEKEIRGLNQYKMPYLKMEDQMKFIDTELEQIKQQLLKNSEKRKQIIDNSIRKLRIYSLHDQKFRLDQLKSSINKDEDLIVEMIRLMQSRSHLKNNDDEQYQYIMNKRFSDMKLLQERLEKNLNYDTRVTSKVYPNSQYYTHLNMLNIILGERIEDMVQQQASIHARM